MEFVKNVLRKENNYDKRKNITKIIAIILLVSMILRFCFVIIHLNHDCTHDDNCPICA